ncbi:MAG: SNF2-related protein [Bacteroidota bacterium]
MNDLETLQNRIKGSRLYEIPKANKQRLYIPYGRRSKNIRTKAWFEIVNDQLKPFVKVENSRHPNYYDDELAARYLSNIKEQFREIINDCELERKSVPLHERLKDDIIPVYKNSKKHQADALRFCCSMKVTAFYADTGTGKSKVMTDLCTSRYEASQINKALIFCPVSTKKNFRNEIKKWASNVPINWKIIGIESMSSSDRAVYEAMEFADNQTQIIIDESHLVKTPIAKRSKRIKKVCDHSSYKVVMTGTPVTENIHNLYMQYAMLSDLIIGVDSWLKFEEKYLILGGINEDEIIGYKNIDHLMGLLEPYTYQISKDEYLDLPAKKEEYRICNMTNAQQECYMYEKEYLLDLIKNEQVEATDIFQIFTRMQQIASGFYFRDFLGTNKLRLFDEVDMSEQTIIFCKYIFEVELIIEYLGKDRCAMFTGQNRNKRDEELESFVSGDKQYFVATMQTGGTGLNELQVVCRQIVFYSNSFSYFQRKQSIGRIDRQGQLRDMRIIDFMTDAGIDDRIIANLSRKENLVDEIKSLMKDKTKLKKYAEGL